MLNSLRKIELIYNMRKLMNLGRRFGPVNPSTGFGSNLFGGLFGGSYQGFEAQSVNKLVKLGTEEQKMINMVNAVRVSRGLKPLEVDMRLVDSARFKSRDMLKKNYFDHYSPAYGSPSDLIDRMRIPYRVMGENLARVPTVEKAHLGLMNSPGHRANILNHNFKRIGVGIVNGGTDGKLFTQHFAG